MPISVPLGMLHSSTGSLDLSMLSFLIFCFFSSFFFSQCTRQTSPTVPFWRDNAQELRGLVLEEAGITLVSTP